MCLFLKHRYTKNSKSDDSVEHLLELGYIRMTNLLANELYKEVIVPTEIQNNMPVDNRKVQYSICCEHLNFYTVLSYTMIAKYF